MPDWSNKVAVVTGAANGIGLAVTKRLIAGGLRVALADYDEEALARAVASFDADRVMGVRVDISDADDVQALATRVFDHFGQVHVLVNNAGVNAYGYTVWEMPRATWDWMFGVNFYGPVNGVNAFLPSMLEAGEGHIVNTASSAAFETGPMRGAYVATKHALLAYSETLYYELASRNSAVRVSVLTPARVRTTIRENSVRRWPSRFGENLANGPESTAAVGRLDGESKNPMVEPEVPAEGVWDALQTGRFLIDVGDRGITLLETRLREVMGLNPLAHDIPLPSPPAA